VRPASDVPLKPRELPSDALRILVSAPGGAVKAMQYAAEMTKHKISWRLSSLAMLTDADIEQSQAMTREQQLATLQEALHHPDASTPTDSTVAEILAEVRAEHQAKRAWISPPSFLRP
jgi:hypothetical protein